MQRNQASHSLLPRFEWDPIDHNQRSSQSHADSQIPSSSQRKSIMATTVYSSISSISPRRALQNKHLVREKSLKSKKFTTAITNMAPKKIGICSKLLMHWKKRKKTSLAMVGWVDRKCLDAPQPLLWLLLCNYELHGTFSIPTQLILLELT